MKIKKIVGIGLLSIIISTSWLTYALDDQETPPISFLLFTLENTNRITIERYSLDELHPQPCHLPISFREGHRLFNIDLDNSNVIIKSLLFDSKDPRELFIIAEHDGKPTSYQLSWASLITEAPQKSPDIETIYFSIEDLNDTLPWVMKLRPHHNSLLIMKPEFDTELEANLTLLLDQPIQAACGTILADNYFSYDHGLFTRTFTKKQIHALGLLLENKPFTKKFSRKQVQQQLRQALTRTSYWMAACAITIKNDTRQSIAYLGSKWSDFRAYCAQRNESKKTKAALQKSFDSEDEFDKLLEDAMNSDLDFLTEKKAKEQPSALTMWFQKTGTYLLMRYIAVEQKIRTYWQSLRGTGNQQQNNEQTIPEKTIS